MRFGQGCYAGEDIQPFSPICDYPEIPPSAAATFNVPVPKFVPPTPPNECVCFSFTKGEANVHSSCNASGNYKIAVEIVPHDKNDCCKGTYDIIPTIDIPCIPFTFNQAETSIRTGAVDEMKAELSFEPMCTNCSITPKLKLVVPAPIAPNVCFQVQGNEESNTKFKLNLTAGTDNTIATANFTVGKTSETTCTVYQIESGSLDLTALAGGDVGFSVEGGTKGTVLRIDGVTDDNTHAKEVFGGGYGDAHTNPAPYGVAFRRGPNMGATAAAGDEADKPILVDDVESHFVNSFGVYKANSWSAGRFGTDGAWTATGDLDIVWPTGMQRHKLGVAMTLTEFEHNSSGVLISALELQKAAIVSPGMSYTIADVVHNNTTIAHKGDPFSGLAVEQSTDASAYMSYGLRVNAGDGLRIYGDGRTADDDDQDAINRFGQLEVHYGKGLRVFDGYDSNNNKKYIDKPSDKPGALEINVNEADIRFGEHPEVEGAFVFNDKKTTTVRLLLGKDTAVEGDDWDTTNTDPFIRNGNTRNGVASGKTWETTGNEIVVPILIPWVGDRKIHPVHADDPWDLSYGGVSNGSWNNVYLAYLRFSKSGILLGISPKPGLSSPTNRATDAKPQPTA